MQSPRRTHGKNLDAIRIRSPRFLLLYSPLQFAPGETAKPDGSLSLAYLAGALRRAGYEARILDCAAGDAETPLEESFFRTEKRPSGMTRVGMAEEAILEAAAAYDVIGVSSIFTPQTSLVLDLIRGLRAAHPDKLILTGGVNARSLRPRFFDAGVDVVALSEAEDTIVAIGRALEGKRALTEVEGIAYLGEGGEERRNAPAGPASDLDTLPMPAWDALPLERYWDISRPHGGDFPKGERIRYASLQTSRGCPFQCKYCHISLEIAGSDAGDLGRFRVKSIDRVLAELDELRRLGVEYVFLEDDSLFAKKKRAFELFGLVRGMGLKLLDVNGINICHLQKNFHGELGPDEEFLQVLADSGLRFLSLPFESANQRLLDLYASGKWNVAKTDVPKLVAALTQAGIEASGNYMIGYPDETQEEMYRTIVMARRQVEAGLQYALFFTVVPFPGSALYESVIANGQLDPNFDTDELRWTKSILRNAPVPAEALEHIRQVAWLTVNRPEYVEYKLGMHVDARS